MTAKFLPFCPGPSFLTRLPPSEAIYELVIWVIIASGNGLSPVRRQAITWTNAGLLSIGLLGSNFNEIWIRILPFSFKKIHLKMSSAKMAAILSRGDEFSKPNRGHLVGPQVSTEW